MGRKRQDKPAPDVHGRVTVINLKGSLEDRLALDRVSDKTMIPASMIVRAGVDMWLKANGHPGLPSMNKGKK